MRKLAPFVFLSTMLTGHAFAADLSGTWKYEKGMDYAGQIKVVPKASVIQIVNGKAAFSQSCFVRIDKARYLYSSPFQMLLKQGVDEAALDKYLVKNFSFALKGEKDYFEADEDANCNAPLREFLVSGNRLLVPFAGTAFQGYVRSDGGTAGPVDPKLPLAGRKPSQLPFSVAAYMNLCEGAIPRVKGVPQATDKCAPVYYPYVASEKDSDVLAKLIGTHDYKKGGASHADAYAAPFASKLHPTFAILPPVKDVLVVRVDDLEGGKEERDTMSGAYLAIRDGKVSDQLNEGCTFDESYACIGEDGKKRFQLLDTGKFKKL